MKDIEVEQIYQFHSIDCTYVCIVNKVFDDAKAKKDQNNLSAELSKVSYFLNVYLVNPVYKNLYS